MRSVLLLLPLLACEPPRAGVEIEDVTAYRDPERRVIVDVLVRASGTLGGSIGTYCTRVVFPGEDPFDRCDADLEDGDTKTLRAVSKNPLGEGNITIRVRHEGRDRGANVAAPR